jgi:predicted metalloprotease with PDZ domain
MRETHRYTRVYWGGACLAFALDVAIRERSGNRRSLDDLLRELRLTPRPSSEAEILAALDAAAGAPRATGLLEATSAWHVEPLLRRLGIVPTGPETVRLTDEAPLASIRRSILGEHGAPALGGSGR